MSLWNPWHGCKKVSPGCKHCYVYRIDGRFGKDSAAVHKTSSFDLPNKRDRGGGYKLGQGETVYTCFSSDFFIEEADAWRPEAWAMIQRRADLDFLIVTKRIHRFYEGLPEDWGDGYPHVTICCTVEDQAHADERLPCFLDAPIRHKQVICEPLLSRINLTPYLDGQIREVIVGGESGEGARVCDYHWVLDLRDQCVESSVRFSFKQTGQNFHKDGVAYRIPRRLQRAQAKKASIDFTPRAAR